jgi:hypothetical protein
MVQVRRDKVPAPVEVGALVVPEKVRVAVGDAVKAKVAATAKGAVKVKVKGKVRGRTRGALRDRDRAKVRPMMSLLRAKWPCTVGGPRLQPARG